MKVHVYYPAYDRHHRDVLEAFRDGVLASGDEVDLVPAAAYDPQEPPDIAVTFGVFKRAIRQSEDRGRVIEGQKAAGKPWLVLETGYVKRDRYYAAGWEGLNGRANFRNRDMPADRWDLLEVELQPWRDPVEAGPILLCGQVPWDASVQDHEHRAWLEDIAQQIMARSGRELLFSPHPLGPMYTVAGLQCAPGRTLLEKARGCWCVVTFSSNSAVEAAIAGIPVFAFDEGSMALPVANRSIANLDNPVTPDRTQWAHDLAYTQWTLEEFRAGLAWKHLTEERP